MKNFIAGMIFATVISPILDSITTVVMTGLEIIKGKWSLKITEYNHQIQKLGDEPTNSHLIGFVTSAEEDDYEDED